MPRASPLELLSGVFAAPATPQEFTTPGTPSLTSSRGRKSHPSGNRDAIVNVVDNRAANRFELPIDGDTAILDYERTSDAIKLVHTEVPEAFRGHGFGEQLVKGAVEAARAEGLRIVAVCPFARAYLRRHPLDGSIGDRR